MGEFVAAALSFPTVLFTFPLLVVIAYWLLVVAGGLHSDVLDGGHGDVDIHSGHADAHGDADGHEHGHGLAGAMGAIGLGGVPVTVALSLLITFGWFIALAGGALLPGVLFGFVVLAVTLVGAWLCARILVVPLRRLFPEVEGASRVDFVGRPCVIRTGHVSERFGQAEVTAADGSTAIVQVRQTGSDTLHGGSSALIYEYDAEGEFFWVVPTPSSTT